MKSVSRPVTVWATDANGETDEEMAIHYEGAKTLSQAGSNGDEVDLHVFPPGEESWAVVTLTYSPDDAERIGMDLIRAAGEARA